MTLTFPRSGSQPKRAPTSAGCGRRFLPRSPCIGSLIAHNTNYAQRAHSSRSAARPSSGICSSSAYFGVLTIPPKKNTLDRYHSTPTFCVRKPNGKWRLVHVYNKLNNATVPAQTPIPRKDALLNNMSGCTLYSALDLVDGYYQILMRESDIPLTAVSTPSGMLCEWLMMPQGLSNAPATFN
ncbi:Hypothetical protein PHPALM_18015, partial [Phytophthora palmivora]